jgi:hypothetical protein
MIVIKKTDVFNYLFTVIIFLPVIFSFFFRITGIPIPSYLVAILFSAAGLFFTINNLFSVSISWLKFYLFIFFIWILSSIFYTPSLFASKVKFVEIIYNTILPILIFEFFFISSKNKEIKFQYFDRYILRYSYFLLWFLLISFLLYKQSDISGRYTIPGIDNAIWFSRFIGMLVLIVICNDKPNFKNLGLYLLTIMIGFFLLFEGGSRGPVLSVLIVFLIKQSYFISKKKLLLMIAGMILFLLVGFIFIGGYLFETDFYSLYARFDLFNALYDFDIKFIKGFGIGSFSILILGEDITYYPHNIFLELFFENGLIGLLLFIIILYLFFRSFKPNVINLLCVYFLIASLVSGDLPGNNNLFILLYISIYANENYKLKNEKISLVNH